jgi:hypothetical protein
MQAGGTIVLIGSIAEVIGTKGYGVYGASKAAVRSFARTWANELAPKGIRANVISPGPTDTAMFGATSDEVRDALTKLIPLGRLGRPDEVAAAALFLASDDSSFTTGAELCVDGGMAKVRGAEEDRRAHPLTQSIFESRRRPSRIRLSAVATMASSLERGVQPSKRVAFSLVAFMFSADDRCLRFLVEALQRVDDGGDIGEAELDAAPSAAP